MSPGIACVPPAGQRKLVDGRTLFPRSGSGLLFRMLWKSGASVAQNPPEVAGKAERDAEREQERQSWRADRAREEWAEARRADLIGSSDQRDVVKFVDTDGGRL